jgi:hypothetical protein
MSKSWHGKNNNPPGTKSWRNDFGPRNKTHGAAWIDYQS